jgi:hypothetical protein
MIEEGLLVPNDLRRGGAILGWDHDLVGVAVEVDMAEGVEVVFVGIGGLVHEQADGVDEGDVGFGQRQLD